MCTDRGAVDHLQRCGVWIEFGQGIKQNVPNAQQRPPPKLAVDRVPHTELVRQVAPLPTSAGDPENPVQRQAVIAGWPPTPRAIAHDKRSKDRPLVVAHQQPCQTCLLSRGSFESRLSRSENPVCQQDLGTIIARIYANAQRRSNCLRKYALPIPRPHPRHRVAQRCASSRLMLLTVCHAATILTPGHLGSVELEILAADRVCWLTCRQPGTPRRHPAE